MTDQPQSGGPRRSVNYGIIALGVAALLVIIQLSVMVLSRQEPQVAQVQATNTAQRPTRTNTPVPPTNTPSSTPVPPTPTRTWTPSPVPPTATPLPPTETPVPSTETPTPTNTPKPATPKPKPPTAVPATATPVPAPLTVLQQMELDNGQYGKGWLQVKYEDDMYATADNGHRYRLELGLLSSSKAQKRIQDFWGYGARGSANWTMTIMVYEEVNWTSCDSSDNICAEGATKSSQANFTARLYLKPKVWKSLLNDYNNGGLNATFSNGYYDDIQEKIFNLMCNCDVEPEFACIGFKFTQVD
jgi:hypothetical protein